MFILVYVSTLLIVAILLMVVLFVSVNAYFKKMEIKRTAAIQEIIGDSFEVLHAESSGSGEVVVRAKDKKVYCFKFSGSYVTHYFQTNVVGQKKEKNEKKRP